MSHKKILIIRYDAVGDMIIALPAIRAVYEALGHPEITVLASNYSSNGDLIQSEPTIKRVWTAPRLESFWDIWRYSRILRSERFDLAIHLSPNPQIAWACFLGIPQNIGDCAVLGLLPVFFKRGRFYPPHDMMSHQVRYDFFLLKSLGIPTELSYQTPLSLAPHPDDQISVVRKMKARGWDAGRATIGIHLGAAGGNKPVLPEIYAAYASELGRIRPDLQFVITGASQEERHFRDRFLAVFSGSLIDMVGVTTLREMVALVAKFDVFVGIDTGPAHIAAAVKTPQLLLMTSKRVIPFKWGPWLNRHIVLSGNRNCVITCHARQCPVWTCSDDMSVTAMADATLRLLSGEGYETFEAQQMHWFQVSMSILMIGDEHSLDVAQRLCDEWRGWGVRVKFVRADNPDLYSECLANDVRIIQNLSGKRRIRLFVMSQLLNRELSHPPMVCHGIPNVNSLGELVSYYRRRFEVRIF